MAMYQPQRPDPQAGEDKLVAIGVSLLWGHAKGPFRVLMSPEQVIRVAKTITVPPGCAYTPARLETLVRAIDAAIVRGPKGERLYDLFFGRSAHGDPHLAICNLAPTAKWPELLKVIGEVEAEYYLDLLEYAFWWRNPHAGPRLLSKQDLAIASDSPFPWSNVTPDDPLNSDEAYSEPMSEAQMDHILFGNTPPPILPGQLPKTNSMPNDELARLLDEIPGLDDL